MEATKRYLRVKTVPGAGFTLVELLVVIAIIGILVALITVAAIGALKTARRAAIKVEMDQISAALENYKNNKGNAYPPNLQVDDTNFNAVLTEPAATPIDESQVLTDLRQHMNNVSSSQREPDQLLRLMVGDTSAVGSPSSSAALTGGMTAGEAVVFWLSGFSSDPNFPISREGGPSYPIPSIGATDNFKLDPIENRQWLHSFAVERLGPRDKDGYFDESQGRFIEYQVLIPGENNNQLQFRRINFWQYTPSHSEQPYLYFDTSRHPAAVISGATVLGPYDPPAGTDLAGIPAGSMALHVHAIKKVNPSWSATNNVVPPVIFVNEGKFQLLHSGIDDDWGEAALELTSVHGVTEAGGDPTVVFTDDNQDNDYLLFPDGPFTAEAGDTIVNFSTGPLQDGQQ